MYLLNDKHSKFEYVIYVRCGNARPYLCGKIYSSYMDVCRELESIAKRNDRYHRVYYIDDDFFENQYDKGEGTYYTILRRTVLDWEEFKK